MMTHPLLFEPLHARYQCHRCDRKFGATAPRVAQREKETQGNGLVTTLPKLCAVCYIAFPLMGILHCFLYIGTLGIDQDGFTGCDYAKDFFQFGGCLVFIKTSLARNVLSGLVLVHHTTYLESLGFKHAHLILMCYQA